MYPGLGACREKPRLPTACMKSIQGCVARSPVPLPSAPSLSRSRSPSRSSLSSSSAPELLQDLLRLVVPVVDLTQLLREVHGPGAVSLRGVRLREGEVGHLRVRVGELEQVLVFADHEVVLPDLRGGPRQVLVSRLLVGVDVEDFLEPPDRLPRGILPLELHVMGREAGP